MSWWFAFSWQNFWFSFLALVFEGVPFILLGSLISGVIGSFVPAHIITGLLPKSRFPALLVSGLLGRYHCFDSYLEVLAGPDNPGIDGAGS